MRLINHPVLCNYYLTYRCNAKCGFCNIWEIPSPYATLENIQQNLVSLKKLGVKVIDFTGGEPLLHQQTDQILSRAKSLGFITTLTTNGLLYPKWADKIQGKIDMLHFSLDYFDRDRHNAARGVDCYDHVMESIKISKSLGERPDILFTVFEDNVDEIGPVYENICLPNNLMLILNPVFDYNEVKTGASLSEATLAKMENWGKKPSIYLNEAFIALRRDGGNRVVDPVCKAGSSTIVISPENKLVLPCYHMGLKEIEINSKLEVLYGSEEVQKLISLEGRLPECEGCTINCYMQPSFAVEVNKYWFKAINSTLKYSINKGTWKAALGF